MITTVRSDLTWDGVTATAIHNSSEKKIKKLLKDMTGAEDVEIIEINSWDEDNEDYED